MCIRKSLGFIFIDNKNRGKREKEEKEGLKDLKAFKKEFMILFRFNIFRFKRDNVRY